MYYFKYKNFLSQSTTDIQNFQFRKLKKLLIKSCEIPYYQDLFDKIKFDPKSDFNSISDLQKFPILSRKREDYYLKKIQEDRRKINSTNQQQTLKNLPRAVLVKKPNEEIFIVDEEDL